MRYSSEVIIFWRFFDLKAFHIFISINCNLFVSFAFLCSKINFFASKVVSNFKNPSSAECTIHLDVDF